MTEDALESAEKRVAILEEALAAYQQDGGERINAALAEIPKALLAAKNKRIAELEAENKGMRDAAEMLWVILANVSGGDWDKQSDEWQEAAQRWRDNYFQSLAAQEGE